MTVYYVDDGGSSTSPYDTWAKAATPINTLDAAIAGVRPLFPDGGLKS
jgi:hypothetical protein